MALDTIRKIGNALLAVLALDSGRIVLVTGIARVRAKGGGMTGATGIPTTLAVIEGEGMRAVVLGREPGSGGMASGTVGAKQPDVIARLAVAGKAVLGGTAEHVVRMTLGARHRNMRAGKRESAESVVKRGRLPAVSRVAGGTSGAILAIVGVIRRVARIAVGRHAFQAFI